MHSPFTGFQSPLRSSLGRKPNARFNPAALFASGEMGVVLDPAQAGLLFQDAQGQVPVLEPGDPVALVLDASQGAGGTSLEQSLGPELFRDPAFATDFSGVLANIGTSLSIGGGELTVINNNTYAGRWTDRDVPLAPSKTYLVEFGVSELLGGSTSVQLRTGDVNLNHNPTSGATSEIYSGLGLGDHAIVVANTSGATIDRYIGTYVGEGGGAFGHRLSYFSIREIPGHHVVQPVNDDYRPTLAQDALGVNYLQLDGVDDFLTATLPDLGSDASEWWADEAGVVISTGQTIGAGARILPGVSKLYGYGLLNRVLTTSETAQLTTYLNDKRGS